MTTRITRTAALLALATLTATACGTNQPPSLFTKGQVSVGVKSDQPGTSYLDGYDFNGFDITVARQLLKKLGTEPNFAAVPSERRTTAVTEGRQDLVIATFSITDERSAKVDFVGPYATTPQGVMVRKDDPRIKNLSDLRGKSVCAWSGTTSGTALQKIPGLVFSGKTTADGCVRALENRQVDAVSTDTLILYGFAQSKQYPNLKVVPGIDIDSTNRYGIAMPKGHREDCYKLRDALRDYLNSSDWKRDFTTELPAVPEADAHWEAHYKPNADDLDKYSCRDKSAP
ncbi:transporter substrate-binding domain-containing protein [Streptomyces sp. 769]|uniref:transporter substrate-binding domain-containing protein n=1 Tax=Streptomyces sp. 769 TaxID=1262452 RepID=UPI000580896D|nr:transporter substrate-binding domain-containing protein [Streptomyces sp. 769]AJC56614.1 ABC-type transporter C periplasmic subunit family 3 [Streptomyces sp. 769]